MCNLKNRDFLIADVTLFPIRDALPDPHFHERSAGSAESGV
jgi:hypothetical protein